MQHNEDPRNIFYQQRQEFAQGTAPQQPAEEPQPTANQKSSSGATSSGKTSDYDEKVRQMKQLAAKYEREGEGQLVKDILNNVIEQKAAGTLSNDQLIAFCKRISPLLNAEQKTRLNALLQELLKI